MTKFVNEAIGQTIEPVQCELTYVNDVFRGEGWDDFEDALAYFHGGKILSASSCPRLAACPYRWHSITQTKKAACISTVITCVDLQIARKRTK